MKFKTTLGWVATVMVLLGVIFTMILRSDHDPPVLVKVTMIGIEVLVIIGVILTWIAIVKKNSKLVWPLVVMIIISCIAEVFYALLGDFGDVRPTTAGRIVTTVIAVLLTGLWVFIFIVVIRGIDEVETEE